MKTEMKARFATSISGTGDVTRGQNNAPTAKTPSFITSNGAVVPLQTLQGDSTTV